MSLELVVIEIREDRQNFKHDPSSQMAACEAGDEKPQMRQNGQLLCCSWEEVSVEFSKGMHSCLGTTVDGLEENLRASVRSLVMGESCVTDKKILFK
eukprot:CAMPEP_0197435744 /NCGR_PEP_ID=MMETSP1175-20131217/3284_1 /TAXON_ID=1003142 /ORGANISM="Triceratium dubium, Strain CCMP147" /LENGTH=96 /DNA_ID=CAMNT_0042964853 /DNA_START=517 /DNA_END=807 /DNA_ORIENTATION=+